MFNKIKSNFKVTHFLLINNNNCYFILKMEILNIELAAVRPRSVLKQLIQLNSAVHCESLFNICICESKRQKKILLNKSHNLKNWVLVFVKHF